MKIKAISLMLLAIIFSVGLNSCSDSDSNDGNAMIKLKLVDAEGDYEKVLVNIIDVQYNPSDDDEGWESFEGFSTPDTGDPEGRIDLCQLIAGNSVVLTEEEIGAGTLKQIRLILGDGNALVLEGDETEIPLNTPSAQQSGLKLNIDTELEAGFSYEFILDWDVQKSIVKAGNSGNYNLKPVIRVTAETTSGSLSGRVADSTETDQNLLPLEGAVVYVFNDGEVDLSPENALATTQSNEEGLFMVQGLPAGNYVFTVSLDTYDDSGTIGPFEVIVGEVTDVGTVLLSLTP